jgi:hypothetical protein
MKASSSFAEASACLCSTSKDEGVEVGQQDQNIFNLNAGLGQYIIGSAAANRMPVAN